MLIERSDPEDVFARVPELAAQTDPVLVQLDRLLDDDDLYRPVRGDLARRSRRTVVPGRHATPGEVIRRRLVRKQLSRGSSAETAERVGAALVLRWLCRGSCRRAPDATTLLRWAPTLRPATRPALSERAAVLAQQATVTRARTVRVDATVVETPRHSPTASGLLGDGVPVLTRPAWCCGPRPCSRSTWQARLPFSAPAGARCGARGRRSIASCAARPPRPAVAQQRPLDGRVLQIAEPTLPQAQTLRQALDSVADPPRSTGARRAPASAADRRRAGRGWTALCPSSRR